jgi:hypothetical protein
MELERVFEQDGVRVVFRNTARHTLRHRAILAALEGNENGLDSDMRNNFTFFAGYAVTVEGLDWKPPAVTAKPAAIVKSYEALLEVVPSTWLYAAASAALDLLMPVANDIEKHDSALSEEEEADPN